MIQVIPFTSGREPAYLPLLARGLSDLSALRFNAVEIKAEVNMELEIDQWEEKLNLPVTGLVSWEEQELWFSGRLMVDSKISLALVLFNPKSNQVVYRDVFTVGEEQFLTEWEARFLKLINLLSGGQNSIQSPPMYTKSLDSFLAFRRGLETILQAKNEQTREEGLESLLKAVAFDPKFGEAVDILLLFLIQSNLTKNYERSISILERLQFISDQYPRIPLVLAEVYSQMGNKKKAGEILENLVITYPKFTEGWIRLALYYHTIGKMDEALEALQNVLIDHPGDTNALDMKAAILAGKDEPKQAEAVWLKALEIEPDRVNILVNLALLAEESDRLDEAESYYRRAVEVNNTWWGSYYHYGSFCQRQKRFEEAAGLLQKAAEINQFHYQTFQNLAMVQFELGHYTKAQESLLRLLQLAPDNAIRRQTLQLLNQFDNPVVKLELRIRHLEQLWESGKRRQTITELLLISNKARYYWYFWFLSGKIARELGLNKLAEYLWSIGLKYQPGFPLLRVTGIYYWEKGNLLKALPLLRRAFRLHRTDPEITRAYLETLANLGELEELQSNIKGISQLKSQEEQLH